MEQQRERFGQPTKLWHFLLRASVAWIAASAVVVVMITYGPVGIAP